MSTWTSYYAEVPPCKWGPHQFERIEGDGNRIYQPDKIDPHPRRTAVYLCLKCGGELEVPLGIMTRISQP